MKRRSGAITHRCCRLRVPVTGFCTNGEEWQCPICKTWWKHQCDEAEGCSWQIMLTPEKALASIDPYAR